MDYWLLYTLRDAPEELQTGCFEVTIYITLKNLNILYFLNLLFPLPRKSHTPRTSPLEMTRKDYSFLVQPGIAAAEPYVHSKIVFSKFLAMCITNFLVHFYSVLSCLCD